MEAHHWLLLAMAVILVLAFAIVPVGRWWQCRQDIYALEQVTQLTRFTSFTLAFSPFDVPFHAQKMDKLWRYRESIKEQFHGAKNRGDAAQAEVILSLSLLLESLFLTHPDLSLFFHTRECRRRHIESRRRLECSM
jgi:hypothetical protein